MEAVVHPYTLMLSLSLPLHIQGIKLYACTFVQVSSNILPDFSVNLSIKTGGAEIATI
jgi:hypothetical protein